MTHSPSSPPIPDAPPPEVLAEVDAAWERSADLLDEDVDLRIRVGTISGRVSGELRCDDAVLLRLAPSQILALACGDPLRLPRRRT